MTSGKTYLRYFLLLFFLFISFPFVFYRPPAQGLDESWKIALHLAAQYDLFFGEDFVFTYGPLGILYTRLPIAVPKSVYLLFDLFFLFNFLFLMNSLLKKELKIGVCLFSFLSFIIVYGEAVELWYFFFYLFYLFSFLQNTAKVGHLWLAGLLAIICFYIKLSLGSVAIAIFLVVIAYLLLLKKIGPKRGAWIVFFFLGALGTSAYFLNVNLRGYILHSLQIISAYNDSMFQRSDSVYNPFLYAALVLGLCYGLLVVIRFVQLFYRKEISACANEFLIYSIIGLFLFVLFKSGFVRNDSLHCHYFFRGIIFPVALLYLFSPGDLQKKIIAAYSWIAISISFWAINTLPDNNQPYRQIVSLDIFQGKFEALRNYIKDVKEYPHDEIKPEFKNATLKEIIGHKSIDVVPVEISQLYFNGLRYNPRPVIQSYSAYNGYLDSLNNRKYLSETAPDYILFSLQSIDNRYPFFDESRTKLAILSQFEVVGEIKDQLLLTHRKEPKSLINEGGTQTMEAKLGEDISIPRSSSLAFTKIFVDLSFFGKVRRLLYQPPSLNVIFTLENGETYTYRGITTILSGGVILNKFIDTNEEFELLMRADGALNTNVKKIRLESSPDTGGFCESIKLVTTHYRLKGNSVSMNIRDSLGVLALFDKYKPKPLADSFLDKDSIRIWVSQIKTHSQFVKITGWAFLENKNNDNSVAAIVLKSRNHIYEVSTSNYERNDLGSFYKRQDLSRAAFSALVTKDALTPGTYRVGVRISNDNHHIDALTFSDHEVVIDKPISAVIPDIVKTSPLQKRPNTGNLLYSVDVANVEGDQIYIQGWAVLKKENAEKTKTSILLESPTGTFRIAANQINRPDLVSHFNDTLVRYGGYSVVIPKDNLPKGIYKIGIEVIYPERNYREVVVTGNQLTHGVSDFFVPVPMKVLPLRGNITHGLDFIKDEKDFLTMTGWAIPELKDFKGYAIQIILSSEKGLFICDTEFRVRTDVTTYFKHQYNLDSCGFAAKIQKVNLPAGEYEIGIYLHGPNEAGKVEFIDKFIIR